MYTMTRTIRTDWPKGRLDQQIVFDAGSPAELEELIQIYESGGEDGRIVEPAIPGDWRARRGFRVEHTAVADSEGKLVTVHEVTQ